MLKYYNNLLLIIVVETLGPPEDF